MKDTKFIELLNLYLDHQISAAEAAELEAEIQRNPARHRLYRQYCQMQKGCTLLTEKFHAEAPSQARLAPAGSRRRIAPVFYYAAGLAAAACVALVVVLQRPGPATPATPALAANTPAALPLPSPALAKSELRTVFTTQALAQLDEGTENPAANPARFDWMNQVQLQPVAAQAVVFEGAQARQSEQDAFRSRRPFQSTVEMTAFRFQK